MNLYSAVASSLHVFSARTGRSRSLQARAVRLLLVSVAGASVVASGAAPLHAQRAPNVDVWFEHGNEFDRGEQGRVMYSGDAGSYVTVLRVDTDGRFRVMSPSYPNDRSRYAGGRDGAAIPFQADPTQGVGYVFAVASRTPFDFRAYRGRTNSWVMGTADQRRAIDPFEIVDRFARNTVGSRGSYSIAYAPYEIGRGGAGRESYGRGVRYDDGYGGYVGGYADPWGASPYRSGYDDFRYSADRYGRRGNYEYDTRSYSDPRTRALRHCPDGTLAPYTTPCSAFSRPRPRDDAQPQTLRPGPMQRPVPQPGRPANP